MAALRLVPASGAAPIDVSSDSALVGRDTTCDIVVSDGSISRKHARLERRGDDWAVVDQGSESCIPPFHCTEDGSGLSNS